MLLDLVFQLEHQVVAGARSVFTYLGLGKELALPEEDNGDYNTPRFKHLFFRLLQPEPAIVPGPS